MWDVFAINPKAPNVTDLIHHTIHTEGEQPVKGPRMGRVSPQIEDIITQQVEEMLKNGIIKPSSSPWASRVILITKRDGGIRYAVDYRALNSITRKDSYPMPIVRDMLDKLNGSQIFSSLDGAAGYILEHSTGGERHSKDSIHYSSEAI